MSISINAGTTKRRDIFLVDPFQLTLPLGDRGRHTPPKEEKVKALAESLLLTGQLEPVEARRDEDDKLILNFGFTRAEAARLIRNGFVDSEGKERKDENFALAVAVTDHDNLTAFTRNVVENVHRTPTSPIDDALNHQKLRDSGMSDAAIRKLYAYPDANKVGRYKRLLELPPELRQAVHEGRMSVSAAIDALALPEGKLSALILQAAGGAEINGSELKKELRGEEDEPSKRNVARTVKEIRDAFQDIAITEEEPDDVRTFANIVVDFINGKCGERKLGKAMHVLQDPHEA